MKLKKISAENFRKIKKSEIEPSEEVNIIYGDNAHGKTSLLEAIWLFTGTKSFRGSKDSEMIKNGEESFKLNTEFFSDAEYNAEIKCEARKQVLINNIKKNSPKYLAEIFHAVIFSPTELSIINDGPQKRRDFINSSIARIFPSYMELCKVYTKNLKNRNALLNDMKQCSGLDDLLSAYDTEIAKQGSKIIKYRNTFLEKLNFYYSEIYSGISGEKEKSSYSYLCTASANEDEYLKIMSDNRRDDILRGTTSVGPHRDDLEILIDGISSRIFASQGQRRSAALALKLSEARVMENVFETKPIILLDDVLSELDEKRQNYILSNIDGSQVFITCCDVAAVERKRGGKKFKVEEGKIGEK